jgi:hypothetical protein
LDELPLSANGKLDRKALPLPSKGITRSVPPRNQTEQIIWDAWAAVLGHEAFGVMDEFFGSVGGNSLSAMSLAAKLKNQNICASVSDIALFGTIEKLASLCKK